MKKNLSGIVGLIVVMLLFVGFIEYAIGFEYIRTWTGEVIATVDVALLDSTKMNDVSDTARYTLEGSYINIRYRTKTDSILTTAVDSMILKLTFTPKVGTGTDTNLYQTKSIAIAAPSQTWTYGSVAYKLDTSTTFNRILNVWFYSTDSATYAQRVALAGTHYHRNFEYWIEVWK